MQLQEKAILADAEIASLKAELEITISLQPEADTDGRIDDRRQIRVKSKAL